MEMIQITGIKEFKNWRGYLGPMVGDTKAQGSNFAVFITSPPYTEPLQEVFLPPSMIRKIK
jgi:hypothetical protein